MQTVKKDGGFLSLTWLDHGHGASDSAENDLIIDSASDSAFEVFIDGEQIPSNTNLNIKFRGSLEALDFKDFCTLLSKKS
jgi:hypothetical protein